MAVFKCKMCGGDLEILDNATVCECEYCGTKQTLPKLNDEKRVQLYDRANYFRRENEFDKAMGIYEMILSEANDDAESYWGIVLCRYGIEYVEDPKTHKRIPTVNRAQFTSIFDDEDYKKAIEYADVLQKEVYEAEATVIDKIQKGILDISNKEEPFDIFICYKETDENGQRTKDSVYAQSIYDWLVKQGYKVFFSRITLEDKLGSAYEPYIFAALNSARVMLVVGTKKEYFNAVWVKNEWSRYLSLIKAGKEKTIIPVYKDISPYDLPEEFQYLQAQDMNKIGFSQDLGRGIRKLIPLNEPEVVKETVVVNNGANATVDSLLKRVTMFLEDGDFKSANEYCEKVLDVDPENALAYLGKLMVELKVSKRESLKNVEKPFDHSNNYQKALRFGNEELKAELTGYIEQINTRNEKERVEGIYNEAKNVMSKAKGEKAYKEAAELFESIIDYSDSKSLCEECKEKAENARKNQILTNGKAKMKGFNVDNYKSAIELFESIPGWKDADEQIPICKARIEEILNSIEEARIQREQKEEEKRLKAERKAEEARIEAERKAEEERIAKEKAKAEAELKAKKNKKIAVITIPSLLTIIVFAILLNVVIIPNSKYNSAIKLMELGKNTDAMVVFESLDGYKDSANKIVECRYNDAIALMNMGKYSEAITAFERLGDYEDSVTKIAECKYNFALTLIDSGKIVEAYETLIALDGFNESAEKAASIYNLYKKEKLKNAQVGDYVFFGTYEQDNNESNGKEYLEWLVLEVKNEKVLLISKNAIDYKRYNTNQTDVTWETCSLRKWLNKDFINTAFSADEKAMIPTVTVSAYEISIFTSDSGNATKDKVFLLSYDEVKKYFSSDGERKCTHTDYAAVSGEQKFLFCKWWLRTTGGDQDRAVVVYGAGDVPGYGSHVNDDDVAVRPALWIDLNN